MIRLRCRVLACALGLGALLIGLGTVTPTAVAEEPAAEAAGEAVKRTVIALYDGATDARNIDVENPIAQVVEMPCNWLGVVVRARHVKDGPPPAEWLQDARAIITWFEKPLALPEWVWPWMEEHRGDGEGARRVIHFEGLPKEGVPDAEQARLASWLEPFGLTWKDGYVEGLARIDIEAESKALCQLEADPRRAAVHSGPVSSRDANRVWVRTRVRDTPDDERTPVVTGEWGGIALSPWHLRLGDGTGTRRWHLDPFKFLRAALGLEGVPAPDPSVLDGRRMFVMHVDGDGFESLATPGGTEPSAQVFLREVIKKYRLPCTASIIVGSLTKTLTPEEGATRIALARAIFDVDQVEIASHGTLHPYDWNQAWGPDPKRLANFAYPGIDGFQYSPAAEVEASIGFIREHLLPVDKDIVGMLWTGESIPPESAIAAATDANCWNLNGGTFRFDAKWDSVGYVSPWGRRIGAQLQVYAGAPNENEFDGYFTTHPGAYRHAATTIQRTGTPRILKPANIYAHYYSAEKPERLRSIQALIERFAFEEETVVVPASRYVRAVQAAYATRLRRKQTGWRFADSPPTLRFDAWEGGIDLDQSSGVIGWREINGALYVHLGSSEGEVVFAAEPARRPHLLHSNHPLRSVELSESAISFDSFCLHADRLVHLGGFKPSSRAELRVGGATRTLEVDDLGRVRIRLKSATPDPVEVVQR